MKSLLSLPFLVLPMLPAAAAIPLPGSLDYTENFDVLGTVTNNSTSTSLWADDLTIPGWFIYRAGNGTPTGFAGAAYQYRVSDGGLTAGNTLMNTGWMYSMGVADSTERAMGSVPITGQGEFSFIAVFENTSALPVRLTNIAYNVEVLHTSQNPDNVESWTVSWKTAATQAELLTLTTAATSAVLFPPEVSTTPSAYYVTGWNAIPAGYTYKNEGVTANTIVNQTFPVAASVTGVEVPAGQFIAIRWGNINDFGADALMGIDDLALSFRPSDQPSLAVTPGAVTVDNKDTAPPEDDEFSIPVTIQNALTDPSTGWHSDESPPRTGTYGTPGPVTFGPWPLSGGAKTVTITDDVYATATATFTATPPAASLTLSAATNIVRNANNPGGADDTVSFDVTITGTNGGPAWVATGTSPLTGAFGPNTLTVPAGLSTFTLTVTDVSYPALTKTITVALPAPYIIGEYDTGGGIVPLFTDAAVPPDAAWVINATAKTITMTNGAAAGAGQKTVTAEAIVPPSGNALVFTANLHIHDLTSGFEEPDNFSAVLIVDGNTASPVLTFSAHDLNGDGKLTGAELCPKPPVNTVQDFDYPLTATVPAGASSVQLVISGVNDSPNETMILSGIRFAPGAVDTDGDGLSDDYETANGLDKDSPADRDLDADGDGQSNYLEFVAGTAANDSNSVLHVLASTLDGATGVTAVTFTSAAGKRYRLQVFAELDAGWTDLGATVTATGTSTTITQTIPIVPLPTRGFLRVKVVP